MRGIYGHLKEYCERTLGPDGWVAVRREAGMVGRRVSPFGRYSDADVLALTGAAAKMRGLSIITIVEELGETVAPGLLGMYALLLREERSRPHSIVTSAAGDDVKEHEVAPSRT